MSNIGIGDPGPENHDQPSEDGTVLEQLVPVPKRTKRKKAKKKAASKKRAKAKKAKPTKKGKRGKKK